jgi:UDP-N-acetylglucosamine 2-epimerase (non-hydrolysing)
MVNGDVNRPSRLLVCAKLLVPVSMSKRLDPAATTMPEEINRLVTDQLADLLFTRPGRRHPPAA